MVNPLMGEFLANRSWRFWVFCLIVLWVLLDLITGHSSLPHLFFGLFAWLLFLTIVWTGLLVMYRGGWPRWGDVRGMVIITASALVLGWVSSGFYQAFHIPI